MSILTNILNRSELAPSDTYEIAGATHVGLVRNLNEDSYLYIRRPTRCSSVLIGVADGMGGHEFGEIASFMVMRYLLTQWNARDSRPFETIGEVQDYLATSLIRANEHIFHVNKELSIRWAMGTTVTMGIIWENKLIIGHVGDSRAYRLRKGKLQALTVDQNWKEEMVRNGVMSEEDASSHPFSNMLTNCVGAMRDLRIDFKTHTMQPGDRYLFCTDGLSSLVPEADLQAAIVEARPARETVRDLVRQALRHGGMDNITAICLYT